MRTFSEFNIVVKSDAFKGDKIKIERILNLPIVVCRYKIGDSKFTGLCMTLQIRKGDEDHVIFTSSTCLIEMIKQVSENDFPFATTIVKKDDRFIFT